MQRLRNLLLVSTALMPLGFTSVLAGPNGATVVGGSATVQNQGTANVTVNQFSDKAIINWNLFNIGVGEKTTFVQPNSNSIALNKVTGGMGPSQILGSLDANGKVFIVNRDGFIFGAGAVVNTAGFLATTSDIKNEDFMAGRFNFQIPGRPDASIVNMGTITATSGGFAALVAPGVRNSGTITATLGTVTLASGNTFNLDFYGDKLVTLGVGDQIAGQVKDVATGQTLKSLITNEGKLKANGGRVELTAAAARQVVDSVINTSGVIEANSVGTKNGQIVLSAATGAPAQSGSATRGGASATTASTLPPQKVKVSGTLSASGKDKGTKGGTIIVTGEHIEVAGATIDASGADGGGKVMIGGDWAGGKPDKSLVNNQSAQLEAFSVANATTVTIDSGTRIDVSAKDRGDGGKVIVWSDQTTTFAGTILALGGTTFGNGGFAEVSGKGLLNYSGIADLRASNGLNGTLLLDPWNVGITNSPSSNGGFSGGTWTPTGTSNILVTDLLNQLLLGNVIVTTSGSGTDPGNITVSANISWSNSNSLTLSAHNNIQITGGVSISNTGGGNLTLRADSDGSGGGRVVLDAGTFPERVNWSNSTGKVSIYENPLGGYTSPTNYVTGSNTGISGGGGGTVLVGPSSSLTSYMLVNTVSNLHSINTNSSGSYALGKNIDASGFGSSQPLTSGGIFSGDGGLGVNSTVTNLTTPLFNEIFSGATVKNLNLANVNIVAPSTGLLLGSLAAVNNGLVANVSASGGTVSSGSFPALSTGGLVAWNSGGTITNSHASINVVGGPNGVGGLVGKNDGTITGSDASGNVTANVAGATIGGLVGQNAGTITNSQVTGGTVSGGSFTGIVAGGLVGQNGTFGPGSAFGTITLSSSAANVSVGNGGSGNANNSAGGLTGSNPGTIATSFATGNVSGGAFSFIGGLTGRNDPGATITGSGATGNVNLSDPTSSGAGGFVGFNFGTISGLNVAGGNVTAAAATAMFLSGQIGGFVGLNDAAGVITGAVAGGNVSAGGHNSVGGFVGFNNGTISGSAAGGNVTGGINFTGGFVGGNFGDISSSAAVGAVSGSGFGTGGFAGMNGVNQQTGHIGTITGSSAIGTVQSTGIDSEAGGFVGQNQGAAVITSSLAFGNVTASSSAGGFAANNEGTISNSFAFGTVTVGSGGTGGGFISGNHGQITNSAATGNVTGADNTVLGGFAAGNFGSISDSTASGAVTATGQNSVLGGFAGLNAGPLVRVTSSGPVSGTSESYLGGLAGINADLIKDSTSSSTVNGSGSHNIAGGLVGVNFGFIDPSRSSGNVSSGPNSIVGGFIGANAALQFPNGFQAIGTATSDSGGTGTASGGAGSTVGPQVGQTYPTSGLPDLPTTPCQGQSGGFLCNGTLFNPNGQGQDHQQDKIVPQVAPLLNIAQALTNDTFTEKKSDEVVNTTTTTTPGSPGSPGGPKGNQKGAGGQAGRPPAIGFAAYGLGPLPSGMPPLNETRFLSNEAVLQIGGKISPEELAAFARKLGLEITYRETIALLGRTVIRFRINSGMPVRDVIAAGEAELGKNFSFQPSYAYNLVQDVAQAPSPADTNRKGDSAQYIVEKLGLVEAHLIATGKTVKVAVIDSEIDSKHPDLEGAVTGSYDALPSDDQTAHPHGTGMAGAIASHKRLLGVAPGAQLLAIRAFGVNSGGAQGTSLNIVKGLQWAVDQGAKVINMSFAGPRDPILQQAMKRLTDQGIILIAAAGNAGPKSPPLFPGADPNVIAVSATDVDDKTYKNANRGKYVAIAAPGVDILVPAPEGGYQLTTGTSVAAAHISGVVALMLERNKELRPAEVRSILSATAKKIGGAATDVGAGLVDPVQALSKAGPKQAGLR